MNSNNPCELYSPHEMAKIAEQIATYKTQRNPWSTFYFAMMGGIFIAIGFVFCITVTTGAGSAPYGLVKLVGGLCFSLGLMLIIVCGGDLFTSTVLTIVAKASGRISWRQLLGNWSNVYVGNFVGAILLVAMILLAGQHNAAHGQWGLNVLQMADYKLRHTFIENVFLGVFANMMVCLAVWMSYAGRTLLDKTLIVLLPIAMFVASGFEHCIANMFLIPLAILIQQLADQEFWTLITMSPDKFSALTWGEFFLKNLVPVTIGNIIGGGVMVGLAQWLLYLRSVPGPVKNTEEREKAESY